MSEWIESHTCLPRHRKMRRLAQTLGIDIPSALGYVHLLWYYALDFAPGGDLTDHDHAAIADGCQWDGEAEVFVKALIKAEWLDASEGLFIHDWGEYNQSHRKRLADAERQRQKRHKDKEKQSLSHDVTVTVTSVTPDRQTDRTDRQTGQPPVEKSERAVLEELQKIPGYPFDAVLDLEMLRQVRDPRVNLLAEVRKYKDWWQPTWDEWKKKKPPKYRLSWRNWLERAEKYCLERNGPIPPAHYPAPKMDEEGAVPMPEELKELMSGIGREMP
jgi:hypothetical protein